MASTQNTCIGNDSRFWLNGWTEESCLPRTGSFCHDVWLFDLHTARWQQGRFRTHWRTSRPLFLQHFSGDCLGAATAAFSLNAHSLTRDASGQLASWTFWCRRSRYLQIQTSYVKPLKELWKLQTHTHTHTSHVCDTQNTCAPKTTSTLGTEATACSARKQP